MCLMSVSYDGHVINIATMLRERAFRTSKSAKGQEKEDSSDNLSNVVQTQSRDIGAIIKKSCRNSYCNHKN